MDSPNPQLLPLKTDLADRCEPGDDREGAHLFKQGYTAYNLAKLVI